MNTIKQLIEKYCPDGVEYKKLGEVCKTIPAPVKVKTSQYFKKGKYAIIDQGQSKIAGYTNDEFILIPKGEYVLYGDHTCTVKYVNFRFAQGADGLKILKTEQLLTKYLYYALSNFNIKNNEYKRHWSIVKEIYIPVPPISVQREIVRILDSFTSLEAELEAELEARRKQYEYYRDQLLSFKHLSGGTDEVEWKTLPQISQNLDSKRKPIKSSRRVAGMYPYYGASGIVDYVEDYIFDGDFLLVSEDGANLLARTSKIAFSISGKNWVNNHAHVLSFNDAVRRKFVEFYIENLDLSRYISAGAQPKLTKDKLNSIPIPQPPYEKQQKIVSILDRFESLVNDISTGLPAEIAARHQQYEYYRDQLLSFKRKS